MIYKVQIWLSGDEDMGEKATFRDLYFDMAKITGFYIPNGCEEMQGVEAVNIFFEGDMMTIKQEPHVLKYLSENFVRNAIIK
jgi:hypothetical protein